MKVLFVTNCAFAEENGFFGPNFRTLRSLRERGVEVRVLAGRNPVKGGAEPEYRLKPAHVPVFGSLLGKQGYRFAKPDDDLIREAVRWADVVHLEEPFALERRVCRIAKDEGKTVTASCRLYPENFYASFNMDRNPLLNWSTMLLWRNRIYNECAIIRCPSQNAVERLKRWRIRPELRLIANGIDTDDNETAAPPLEKKNSLFYIVTTGRLSNEKDQLTLLRAMQYSKHHARIKLIFAGRGPKKKALKAAAERLRRSGAIMREPVFCSYGKAKLREIYKICDLYVHCSTAEVESPECAEALAAGLVPVVAKGRKTAAYEYAKHPMSVFPERDAGALAKCIDYWIEHEDERKAESGANAGMAGEYGVRDSAEKLVEMFEDALRMKKNNWY